MHRLSGMSRHAPGSHLDPYDIIVGYVDEYEELLARKNLSYNE